MSRIRRFAAAVIVSVAVAFVAGVSGGTPGDDTYWSFVRADQGAGSASTHIVAAMQTESDTAWT
ncbi:hypothetical protein P3T27_000256 [Kitasatospora sp. MAA19]|uniref:hypothetical protein n=1 Tax=unclassified Kitasatospora TaxID=2633591 RepID=UPI0024769B4C|nr:hypothetical protein [Kitasatospora sp. MAA19]MDH6703575.1 hypothetical protein [Kitasatospora sp. MAA19]